MTDETTTEEVTHAPTEQHPESRAEAKTRAGRETAGDAPVEAGDADELEPSLTGRQARRDERWRDRARAAEARADRLATREVLRLLGGRVSDAQVALAMSGEAVADLLTEEGEVDDEAVADLAARVLEQHPALRKSAHHLDLGPKQSTSQRGSASWGGLLRKP